MPRQILRRLLVTVVLLGLATVPTAVSLQAPAVAASSFTTPHQVSISGTARVGSELTAVVVDSVPVADRYSFTWWRLRWVGFSLELVQIPGATSSRYTPTGADLGTMMMANVVAHKAGYDNNPESAQTTAVRPAVTPVLAAVTPPTLPPDPRFGEPLELIPGTWSTTPDAVTYVWSVDGQVRPGIESTYLPTLDDIGGTVTVTATASKSGYVSGTATASTGPVARRAFTRAPLVTLTGDSRVGATLSAEIAPSAPTADQHHLQWLAVDPQGDSPPWPIPGAHGPTLDVGPDLAGATLRLTVTAARDGFEDLTASADTVEPVGLGVFSAPAVEVSGHSRVGSLLRGRAEVDPFGLADLQWLRDGRAIPGATADTYRAGWTDLGRTISLRVTVRAPGFTTVSATSVPRTVTLGATRLEVTVPAKAKVGTKATIKVTGLARAERFTVTVAGRKVTGTASSAGLGSVRVPVSGKPGSRPVTVVGSLPDRKGSATLRVVKE